MRKLTPIKSTKHYLKIIGFVFIVLKLFKAVNFNWFVTMSPFLILIFTEFVFFVWGYIIYCKIKNKNG